MRSLRLRTTLFVAIVLTASGCLRDDAQDEERLVTRIRNATVLLEPSVCAGALVGDGFWVLTAAHCVQRPGVSLPVTLSNGRTLKGQLFVVDRDNDMALVHLDERAPFEPLSVADALPHEGESVFFVGRRDRPIPTQIVSVERLAPCPSLPSVPMVLHTGMKGRPGDSGAPVVDFDGRIVGLVHGGAACSIAAPTTTVAPVLGLLAP